MQFVYNTLYKFVCSFLLEGNTKFNNRNG